MSYEDTARELRDDAHTRLRELATKAQREVIRIEAFDQVLGEHTVEAGHPFPESTSAALPAPSSTSPPSEAARQLKKPKPKLKKAKIKTKPKSAMAPGTPLRKPGMSTLRVVEVLESNPGIWWKPAEVKRGGKLTPTPSNVALSLKRAVKHGLCDVRQDSPRRSVYRAIPTRTSTDGE